MVVLKGIKIWSNSSFLMGFTLTGLCFYLKILIIFGFLSG